MSRRPIPFLSSKHANDVEGYRRFCHSKGYIRLKSDTWRGCREDLQQTRALMALCGYSDLEKFRKHRAEWNELNRRIPIAYLDAIGVDLETLKSAVQLDQNEYRSALKIPLHPKYGGVRHLAAFCGDFRFPDDTPEVDAILILQEYSRRKRRLCWINYPDLKTIWIHPDGSIDTSYYEPKIRITKRYVIPSESGTQIGRVLLR